MASVPSEESHDKLLFSMALNRGFYSLIAILFVAPSVLIALKPTSPLGYAIAALFVPGILMAILRKRKLKTSDYQAIAYQHWQAQRPSVFQLPFWIPLTNSSAPAIETPPSDLHLAYAQVLKGQRNVALLTAAIMVLGLPAAIYLVGSSIGRPFKLNSLVIPFVVTIGFLITNLVPVFQELKKRQYFNDWVEAGCPKVFSLEARKK